MTGPLDPDPTRPRLPLGFEVGRRALGEDEAQQIAERYGVVCPPGTLVHRIRRGASIRDTPLPPGQAINAGWRAMLRRARFRRADAKRRREEAEGS